ncbi:MAG TPA: YciI family protein [Sphingomonas sp.]|nr:YciI family protein [Sphingomonas sp.]
MADDFRASGPLSLIVLTYVKPLDEVDAQLPAHVAWLKQGFEQGLFVVAGRRTPRTGGVILVRGERAPVDKVAATDPFVTSGVATTEVIPFNASFAAPELAALLT